MKFLAPSGQTSKAQSFSLVITAGAATIALLYFGRAFWITLVVSVILAFMLEPFVLLFMRLRLPRGVASLLVCSIALFVLYLLGAALFTQLVNIADDLPVYSQRVNQLVDSVAERFERAEQQAYRLLVPRRFRDEEEEKVVPPPPDPKPAKRRQVPAEPPEPPPVQEVRIREERASLVNYAAGYVSSFYNALLMISFVPFLVYFMLSWRDHLHRSFLALHGETGGILAGRSVQTIAVMARGYVVGNVILGLMLAVVSCVIFWSWQLPYWILIGFLSGFLSLIPYVGLPLAMIPAIAAALMTYYTVTPFLIIAAQVAVLHLLALNLLYPAVVGARVHLNPLAVTVALMFWGTIWGGIGLILAIPITAAIKAILDNNEDLQPYGRLLGD